MKREPTRPDAVNSAGMFVGTAPHGLFRDLSREWQRWSMAGRVAASFLLAAVISALSVPLLTALGHPTDG
jgi:hypothetical protein